MKKMFWMAATAFAFMGASTLIYAADEIPKGAVVVKGGITSVPVNIRDQALVKSKRLLPKYHFMTMEQCNAIFFCTCFMNGDGVTCYTMPTTGGQSTQR